MLPPSPSGVSSRMEWCHLSLCVYLALTQRPNTTSITPLYYPSLDSVALFPSQKLPHQQPSKYTRHPSLSTYQQWRRNPSFGRGERGISHLCSSQPGPKCRESFTNWCLRMIGRKKRSLLLRFCVWIGGGFCAYLCCVLLSTPPNNIYILYCAAWILKATF